MDKGNDKHKQTGLRGYRAKNTRKTVDNLKKTRSPKTHIYKTECGQPIKTCVKTSKNSKKSVEKARKTAIFTQTNVLFHKKRKLSTIRNFIHARIIVYFDLPHALKFDGNIDERAR